MSEIWTADLLIKNGMMLTLRTIMPWATSSQVAMPWSTTLWSTTLQRRTPQTSALQNLARPRRCCRPQCHRPWLQQRRCHVRPHWGDNVAGDKNYQPLRWHWSKASLPLASTTLWPTAPRLSALFLFWQVWQASYREGPPGRFPPFHRSACRHTGWSRSSCTHGGVVQMSSLPQAIESLRRSIPVGSTSDPKNDTCTLHKPWFIPSSCPVSYPWRLRGPWLIGSWPLSWMWGPEICGWFLSMCHPQLLWLIPLYSCNSGMNCDNTWCICTSIMARLAGRSASMPPRSWASNSSWTRCSTRWTYCTLHNK